MPHSNLAGLFWLAIKAFLMALILTPIVRDIFRSYNVVDRPGRRKVHAYPIPRVGGIPIAIAYAISLTALSQQPNGLLDYDSPLSKLIPGGATIFLIGLLDDFFNLKPLVKLAGQIAAAALVFASGLRIETIANISLPTWCSLPITLFWLLLATNALNLIDGLDGLCAGMGFLATLTLFAAALIQSNYCLAYATLPLAGALLGFLCFNFNPATVFLGDSGALTIGFLLGCYGMIWTGKTATLISVTVPLFALSVPLMDVSLSILRRSLKNHPIFGADRGHIHHRLLDRGLSPRRAVLVLYLVALLAAGIALLLIYPSLGRFQAVIIVAGLLIAWTGIHQLRYSEFDVARRLIFGGEFQRTLARRVRLEQLGADLKLATTEDDWWNILVKAARETGWVRIAWKGQDCREKRFSNEPVAWSFQISIREEDHICVDGGLTSPSESVDLLGFAGTIRHSFSEKQHQWEPLALP
jgi:UDP-GlcNAc:undecaprenyl-phosphate/decaprenyl-phosphate GlcNAc-1-phosphate transferase